MESQYELIVSRNEMVIEIDNEIEAIAKIIKDEYSRCFPDSIAHPQPARLCARRFKARQ